MDQLYKLVFDCWTRNENVNREYFVSSQDLREHMTPECLRKAVDEVLGGIKRGGHKTFAIFILIKQPKQIIKFIEYGQHLSYGLTVYCRLTRKSCRKFCQSAPTLSNLTKNSGPSPLLFSSTVCSHSISTKSGSTVPSR